MLGWFRIRSRPLMGLVLFAVGVSVLAGSVRHVASVTGFYGEHWTWDAGGLALGALFVGAAVLLWRRVI